MYQELKTKLQNFPDFRERRFREKYLVILALRKIGLEKKDRALTHQELAEFAITYDSYRNIWDKVLRENPELQGKDYDDGKILEQKKILELGYAVGYNQDVQQLKML